MAIAQRTQQQVQDDRDRLAENVSDALAVADMLPEPKRSLALPAIINATITAKSLGGLLKKLFGVANRDMPYYLQTQTYPIAATAGTAGVSARDVFSITQDSDFYAMRMAYCSGDAGTVAVECLLQLVRQSNGQQMFSNANGGHMQNYQGTGQRPFVFPNPLFIPRNQTISVIFTNIAAVAQGPFYLDFIGRKAVDVSALDLTSRRW